MKHRAHIVYTIFLPIALSTSCSQEPGMGVISATETTLAGTTGPSTTATSSSTADASTTSATSTTTSATSATSSSTTAVTGASTTTGGMTSTTSDTTGIESSGSGCDSNCLDDLPKPPECSITAQDCPGGQKCMPYASDMGPVLDSVKCVAVDGAPNKVGESCTVVGGPTSGVDSCDAKSMCWGVDPKTLQGECYPFCAGKSPNFDCGVDPRECFVADDELLLLCMPTCHPYTKKCPPGKVCAPHLNETFKFGCFPDASGLEGQEFDPCYAFNGCDPGLVCVPSESAAECDQNVSTCCVTYCKLSLAGPCTGVNQECLPWYEMGNAPPGYDDLGVCKIPQ